MSAYYNEHDPFAAQWLRNLITAGHIAPGDVDERSILDVRPDDLAGYVQCHFFAGIGVWSAALRAAGWPDERPVWTGSCPCQPFSAAGKGGGFADERHLWPAWQWLVEQRGPVVVFGEQVEAAIRLHWLDLVFDDLEALGYACGAAIVPAAGSGAPHIRHRIFFVADANDARSQGRVGMPERADQCAVGARGMAGELADANGGDDHAEYERVVSDATFDICGLGDAAIGTREWGTGSVFGAQEEIRRQDGPQHGDRAVRLEYAGPSMGERRTGPTNGFWRNADWLLCRDDRWRPVEPGTFPLAHGASARVGRLRAYGNAIVPQVAAQFIGAYMDLTN